MRTVPKAIFASAVLSLTALTSFGLSSVNWTEVPIKYAGNSTFIRNYLGLCSAFEKYRDIMSAGGGPYDPKPTDTNEYNETTKYVLAKVFGSGKVLLDPYAYIKYLDYLVPLWQGGYYGLAEDAIPNLATATQIETPFLYALFPEAGNPLSFLNEYETSEALYDSMKSVAYDLYGRRDLEVKYKPQTLSDFAGFDEDDMEVNDFYDMASVGYGKTPLYYNWVPKVGNIYANTKFYWLYWGALSSLFSEYEIVQTNYSYSTTYAVESEFEGAKLKAKIVSKGMSKDDSSREIVGDISSGFNLSASSDYDDETGIFSIDWVMTYDPTGTAALERTPMTNGYFYSNVSYSFYDITDYTNRCSLTYSASAQRLKTENVDDWIIASDYPEWSALIPQRELFMFAPYSVRTTFNQDANGTMSVGDVRAITNGAKRVVARITDDFSAQLSHINQMAKLEPKITNVGVEYEMIIPTVSLANICVWTSGEIGGGDIVGFGRADDIYGPLAPLPPDVPGSFEITPIYNSDYYDMESKTDTLQIKAHAFTRERLCTDNLAP